MGLANYLEDDLLGVSPKSDASIAMDRMAGASAYAPGPAPAPDGGPVMDRMAGQSPYTPENIDQMAAESDARIAGYGQPQSAIPEEGGVDSVADALFYLMPGDSSVESGMRKGVARVGELADAVVGAPTSALQAVGAEGAAALYEDYIAEPTNEYIIKNIFGDREQLDREFPQRTWEAVSTSWSENGVSVDSVAKTMGFMVQEGFASAPDLVAMVAAPWAYLGTRTAEITEERRENTGELTNVVDIAIAGGTAAVVQKMDKLAPAAGALSKYLGKNANKAVSDLMVGASKKAIAARIVGDVAVEASTEATQEYIEWVASNVRRDFKDIIEQATDPAAAEAALIGAVASGGMGIAGATYNEVARSRASRQTPPDGTDTDQGVDESLDAEVARLLAEANVGEQLEMDLGELGAAPENVGDQAEMDLGDVPADAEEAVAGVPDVDPRQQELDLNSGEQLELPLAQEQPAPESGGGQKDEEKEEGVASDILATRTAMQGGGYGAGGERVSVSIPGDIEDSTQEDLETRDAQIRENQELERRDTLAGQTAKTAIREIVRRGVTATPSEPAAPETPGRNETEQDKLRRQKERLATARQKADSLRLADMADALVELERLAKKPEVELVPEFKTMEEAAQFLKASQQDANAEGVASIKPSAALTFKTALREALSNTGAKPNTVRLTGLAMRAIEESDLPQAKDLMKAIQENNINSVRELMTSLKNEAVAARAAAGDAETQAIRRTPTRDEIVAPTGEIEAARRAEELRGPGVSGAPKVTAADMYQEAYTDAEGNQKTRVAYDSDPVIAARQRAERVAAVEQEEFEKQTQTFGPITTFKEPGNQYVDREVGGKVVRPAQRVTNPTRDREKWIARDTELRKASDKLTQDKNKKLLDLARKKRELKASPRWKYLDADERFLEERMDAYERKKVVDDYAKAIRSLLDEMDAMRRESAMPSELTDRKNVRSSDAIRRRKMAELKAEQDKADKLLKYYDASDANLATAARDAAVKESKKKQALSEQKYKRQKEKELLAAKLADMTPKERAAYEAEQAAAKPAKEKKKKVALPSSLQKAKDTFRAYIKNQKATGEGQTGAQVEARIHLAAKDTIPSKGLGSIYILNPVEDRRKELGDQLVRVEGAYPKRTKIVLNEKGGVKEIKRAIPHMPGDKTLYESVKNRLFYYPEDVEIIRGRRIMTLDTDPMGNVSVAYKPIPKTDTTITPSAMDSLLKYVGTLGIEWEGKTDEEKIRAQKAFIQYVMSRKASGVSSGSRGDRTPTRTTADKVDERFANFSTDGPTEVDEVDEGAVGIDPDVLIDILSGYASEEGAGGEYVDHRKALVEARDEAERAVQTVELEYDNMVAVAESTVVGDDGGLVVSYSKWPTVFDVERDFMAYRIGDIIYDEPDPEDSYIEEKMKSGESQDAAMQRVIRKQIDGDVKMFRDKLAAATAALEEYDAGRAESQAGKGPEKKGAGKKKRPADWSDADGPAQDGGTGTAGRTTGNVPSRYDQSVPVDPDKRQARDLYEGLGPDDGNIADYLKRARAYQFSGDRRDDGLNGVQVRGVALAVRQWEAAIENNGGAFLNMDGTGFGKSRQIAAAAKLIADKEAETGRNRPVAVLVPGGQGETAYVTNITGEWARLGVDKNAKYANGQPMFVVRTYKSLEVETGKKEYAAVLADEAHSVKGTGLWSKGFDKLNTPFRGFFTATPTDAPGQELYYLKHLARKPKETVEQAEARLVRNLGLSVSGDNKGILKKQGFDLERYGFELNKSLGPAVKRGALVSRSYGRIAETFTRNLATTEVDGKIYRDEEAEALYQSLLDKGYDKNSPTLVRLNEHIKIPYMVARAQHQIAVGQKVIAVFQLSGATDSAVLGPKYSKAPIEVFNNRMGELGYPRSVLYGSGKNNTAAAAREDRKQINDFQDGLSKVMIMTDARGGTGLNLNDSKGGSARYMLIASTSTRGDMMLQLLGRHDRKTNKTVPYVEFVKAANPTDLSYRLSVVDRVNLQNQISGLTPHKEINPELYPEEEVFERGEFQSRIKYSDDLVDGADDYVLNTLRKGPTKNVRGLLRAIAVRADNPDLASLASRLADIQTGWGDLNAQMIAEDQRYVEELGRTFERLGAYDPPTETVYMSENTSATQTFLHEVAHHFTHKRVDSDPELRGQLRVIMDAIATANPELVTTFANAFREEREFIADFHSSPGLQAMLKDTVIDKGKKLNAFQRILRWFGQRVLRMSGSSYNAYERIMELDTLTANGGLDFDSMPLDKIRIPKLPRVTNDVISTVERAKGWADKARGAMIWTMTYDQIAETYEKIFQREVSDAGPGSIITDLRDLQEEIAATASKENLRYSKQVVEKVRKFMVEHGGKTMNVYLTPGDKKRARKSEVTVGEFLATVMNSSGYNQLDFSKASLDDKANSMGKSQKHSRVAWDLYKSSFDSPAFAEGKKLYEELAKYFAAEQDRNQRLIGGLYLDTIDTDRATPWAQEEDAKLIKARLKELAVMDEATLQKVGGARSTIETMRNILKTGRVRGAYFPLKRYGDYVVSARGETNYVTDRQRDELLEKHMGAKDDPEKNKITYRTMARFESRADAEAYREALVQEYAGNTDVEVDEVSLASEPAVSFGGTDSFSAMYQNFSKNLDKRGLEKEQTEVMKTVFTQALLDMMPQTSSVNALRERVGIMGASTDMMRVLHDHGASKGFTTANLVHSKRKADLLLEMNYHVNSMRYRKLPGTIAAEQVRRAINKRELTAAQNSMDLGRVPQVLNDVGFAWYLVGVSYNIVNMTQVPLVAAPVMASRHGSKRTAAALASAYKNGSVAPLGKLLKTGGSLTELKGILAGKDFDTSNYDVMEELINGLSDPNHKKLVEYMRERGDIEASLAMDMGRNSARSHIDKDGRPKKTGRLDYFTDWMRMAPHLIEVHNRTVTALAAFDLEFERTKDFDKAMKYARKTVKTTQFVYQNWNKPPAFQHPVGRTMLMFKQHVQHMYFLMVSNAVKSMPRIDKTASEADQAIQRENRSEARKGLMFFVLMHVMAAGAVGGTPEPIKWLVGLLAELFGDDEDFDFDREFRNLAYDMFGKNGATMATLGLPGFVGVDLSSRVGIDSMLMFEGVDFSEKSKFAHSVARLLGGPLYSLAENFATAPAQAARTGDYSRVVESLLPKSIKDPMKAMRIRDEGFVDLSGKQFASAEALAPHEYFMQAIGFTPATTTEIYASRNTGRDRAAMTRRRNAYFTKFYNADTGQERQYVIDSIRKWNRDNPHFAITRANLLQSVQRRKQIEAETEGGVYTPKGQRNWVREEQRSFQTRY